MHLPSTNITQAEREKTIRDKIKGFDSDLENWNKKLDFAKGTMERINSGNLDKNMKITNAVLPNLFNVEKWKEDASIKSGIKTLEEDLNRFSIVLEKLHDEINPAKRRTKPLGTTDKFHTDMKRAENAYHDLKKKLGLVSTYFPYQLRVYDDFNEIMNYVIEGIRIYDKHYAYQKGKYSFSDYHLKSRIGSTQYGNKSIGKEILFHLPRKVVHYTTMHRINHDEIPTLILDKIMDEINVNERVNELTNPMKMQYIFRDKLATQMMIGNITDGDFFKEREDTFPKRIEYLKKDKKTIERERRESNITLARNMLIDEFPIDIGKAMCEWRARDTKTGSVKNKIDEYEERAGTYFDKRYLLKKLISLESPSLTIDEKKELVEAEFCTLHRLTPITSIDRDEKEQADAFGIPYSTSIENFTGESMFNELFKTIWNKKQYSKNQSLKFLNDNIK